MVLTRRVVCVTQRGKVIFAPEINSTGDICDKTSL